MGSGGWIAKRILLGQTLVTLVGVMVAYLAVGGQAAWSAMLGGSIALATTGWFALRVFAKGPDAPLKQVVRAFYAGEVQKLLLTALLFYLVIRWAQASFLPLLLTYMGALLVYWLILPFSQESR